MIDGNHLAQLVAEAVLTFKYSNSFDNTEDALPAYIGEVKYRQLSNEDLHVEFGRLGYGFTQNEDRLFKNSYFLIQIEGGEISIDILCGGYKFFPRDGICCPYAPT